MGGSRRKPVGTVSALLIGLLVLLASPGPGWTEPAPGQPGFGGLGNTPTTTPTPAPITTTIPTPPAPNPVRDGTTVSPTPNPGDLAGDLIRSQAEAEAGPVLKVLRIDSAQEVFSSPDPDVQAAVAAWVASLDYPHDQWGNYRGPGYVGAYRPDSVHPKLAAYLVEHLNGKRLFAVNQGQAGALETLAKVERTKRIEAIIQEKTKPPPPPTTPTGPAAPTNKTTPENVPNISKGGDQNGGGSNPPGSPTTGTTPTTSPAGGGGSPVFNPPANAAKLPATTGFLLAKSKDDLLPSFKETIAPKAFTDEEKGWVNEIIGLMPKAFSERVTLARVTAVGTKDGASAPTAFGLTRTPLGGSDMGRSVTQIADLTQAPDEGTRRSVGFPVPPYSQAQSLQFGFEGTIAHEFTHAFLRYNPGDVMYTDMADNPIFVNWLTVTGWKMPKGAAPCLDKSRTAEPPTAYATTSPEEDMAESVLMYLMDPARLKRSSTARYNFVKDVLKIAEHNAPDLGEPAAGKDPRFVSFSETMAKDGTLCP